MAAPPQVPSEGGTHVPAVIVRNRTAPHVLRVTIDRPKLAGAAAALATGQ